MVETGRLEADSRRYYRNGWRLLDQTKIAAMRMDQITKDEVEKLKFLDRPQTATTPCGRCEECLQIQGGQADP